MPASAVVGTDGNAGSRDEANTPTMRNVPALTCDVSAEGTDTTASIWPPSKLVTTCDAPKGTCMTSALISLKNATDEMCV